MASVLYITPLNGINKQDWYPHSDTKAYINNTLATKTQGYNS